MPVKEQICTFQRTTILPSTRFAIFCLYVSLSENLLCRGDSPFVIRSYLAHLDRKWESVLLKSKTKPCILQSASFMKELFWRCRLANIFLYFILCSILHLKKHIPDTSQHFLIAVLLPCGCCLLKHVKTVWMLYRKTTSSPGVKNYPWNYTDFIQIKNLAKSNFRWFSCYYLHT